MTPLFTADLHLGHANIIKYANRPFGTVEEMDNAIIQNINTAAQGRVLYVLGDFAFGDHDKYLERLSVAEVHLIIGNHDHSNRVKAPKRWTSIQYYKEVSIAGELAPVVLFHYAMRVWNRSHHGAIHLYGHSHGGLLGDSQSCDVGVDCWSFCPVTLSEIKARLAKSCQRGREPDHHGNSKV